MSIIGLLLATVIVLIHNLASWREHSLNRVLATGAAIATRIKLSGRTSHAVFARAETDASTRARMLIGLVR